MKIKEAMEELKEFYNIQEKNQDLQRRINLLYSLINEYSKKTSLKEILDHTLQKLDENTRRYNELYQRYFEGQDYLYPENPLFLYRDLNAAITALMKEQQITFQDLERQLPYSASKLENIVKEKKHYEDSHAVYCVLCDYFNLDKQQYRRFTKVEPL
jgi:hypothetical protein